MTDVTFMDVMRCTLRLFWEEDIDTNRFVGYGNVYNGKLIEDMQKVYGLICQKTQTPNQRQNDDEGRTTSSHHPTTPVLSRQSQQPKQP